MANKQHDLRVVDLRDQERDQAVGTRYQGSGQHPSCRGGSGDTKNSWSTWLLSPVYKKAEDSNEEKARKDRARQERMIEKDMKERRLDANKARLKTTETSMRTTRAEIDAADSRDEAIIQNIRHGIWMKESRQRQEKEKAEKDRKAQQMRQQQEQREKREREAAEALRQQAANRAAEQKRYEEESRNWQKIFEEEVWKQREHSTFSNFGERLDPQTRTATCQHDGW
jgi:hypothetical protein